MSLQSQIDILALGLCNVYKSSKNGGDRIEGFYINESGSAACYIDAKGQIFIDGATNVEETIFKTDNYKVRLINNDGSHDAQDKMINSSNVACGIDSGSIYVYLSGIEY